MNSGTRKDKNLTEKLSYKDAGVDIKEGERAVELMKEHVKSTFGPQVLDGLGGFGSLFKPDLGGLTSPVLVAGCDGVGTKLKVAIMMDKHDTVGQDLVAMCVNDILCQGAMPLFFLDYIATGALNAEKAAELVKGVAQGCKMAECALVGGETAEMPGFYGDGDYDMAGFAVGIVDEEKIIDGRNTEPGDILIGLPSSGLHSNGFSLVRKLFFEQEAYTVDSRPDWSGCSLGEELLTPTRIYTKEVKSVLSKMRPKAIAHITGGGIVENVPRVLPAGLGAMIHESAWKTPGIFKVIREKSGMDREELFSSLNMGVGLVIIVKEDEMGKVFAALEEAGEDKAFYFGNVVKGAGVEFSG